MPFDGTQLSKTTQKLLAAKQYLIDFGWLQGYLVDTKGRTCMIGALQKVNGQTRHSTYFLWKAISIESRERGRTDVINWNDVEGRTFDEVLAAFDRAIALSLT